MKASALAARDRVLASRRTRRARPRPPAPAPRPPPAARCGRPRPPRRTGPAAAARPWPTTAAAPRRAAARSAELVEQAGRLGGGADPVDELRGLRLVEERPAGAGPHRAERVAGRAEPGPRRVEVTADERDRPRPHVLLLAHHLVDALGPVGVERLVRVLEQIRAGGGRDRAHRRRQVQQPARVDREPAHHLERRGRVLLPDADPPLVARLDDPASGHVADVEHLGLAVSGLRRPRRGRVDRKRPGRLVVDPLGRDGDDLPLRVAQRGEPAAEHAPGVQAQGVVDPLRRREPGCARRGPSRVPGTRSPTGTAPAARTRRSPPSSARTGRTRAPAPTRARGSARPARRARHERPPSKT